MLDKRDKVTNEWRAGIVDRWAPAMGGWIHNIGRVSIKPNESVRAIVRGYEKDDKGKYRVRIPIL